MPATWCIRRLCPPLLLSLLSNMPAVTLLIITFNFTMCHLVIDEIPPGSHLSHIPDLYAVNNDDHQEQPPPITIRQRITTSTPGRWTATSS